MNLFIIRGCLFTDFVTGIMENQRLLVDLIQRYVRRDKKVFQHNSYYLKHIFEVLMEGYVSNDDFKACMMLAGFPPCSRDGKNCYYKIKLVDTDELIERG